MAEIRNLTTLIAKRDEIERSIANYEAGLEQARADLSHVNACIRATRYWREPWRLGLRMIHALRQQWKRGHLDGEEKVKGTRVWATVCESEREITIQTRVKRNG
jgi:hypothetical protein